MSGTPHPNDPSHEGGDEPAIAAAADRARELLHEEVERMRVELEGTLSDGAVEDAQLRRELDDLREEIRLYVKERVRKSEGKVERKLKKRVQRLEKRIDEVEESREQAEWRIHADMAAMLDGHLATVRAIADRLEGKTPPTA